MAHLLPKLLVRANNKVEESNNLDDTIPTTAISAKTPAKEIGSHGTVLMQSHITEFMQPTLE